MSWNVLSLHTLLRANRHPLREDVSWNTTDTVATETLTSHPLREDVSWNTWGNITTAPSFTVILFVRMWVEMMFTAIRSTRSQCHPLREDVSWNVSFLGSSSSSSPSSSSWGCELKYWYRIQVWIFHQVILFVRMWVEILKRAHKAIQKWSSSSWGCELKWL